jgi:hypothetical protein
MGDRGEGMRHGQEGVLIRRATEGRVKEQLIQKWIAKGHSRKGAERLAEMEMRHDPRLKPKG